MDTMSSQIREYELLMKQLKVWHINWGREFIIQRPSDLFSMQLQNWLQEEVKAEKSKARDEAEDLAQEMAELRYQLTGLLEEERKRRACIEQISLQRIAQLEAQVVTLKFVYFSWGENLLKFILFWVLIKIKREQTKSFSSVRLIHEGQQIEWIKQLHFSID